MTEQEWLELANEIHYCPSCGNSNTPGQSFRARVDTDPAFSLLEEWKANPEMVQNICAELFCKTCPTHIFMWKDFRDDGQIVCVVGILPRRQFSALSQDFHILSLSTCLWALYSTVAPHYIFRTPEVPVESLSENA